MKKGVCELCSKTSRLHCESDQARLCWECDEKVHGANFLVAKHYRSLLCHVCQSTTQWKACGPKLLPTVSVCANCFVNNNSRIEDQEIINQPQMRDNQENEEVENGVCDETESEDDDDGNQEYNSSDDDYYEEYEDTEYEDVEDDDDGENQVVPWMESS